MVRYNFANAKSLTTSGSVSAHPECSEHSEECIEGQAEINEKTYSATTFTANCGCNLFESLKVTI